MMRSTAFSIFILSFTLYPCISFSTTIHVPADQPTIQQGIDSALDGDIVLVSPGTYYENINFLGKAITLQSASGEETTVIEGSIYAPVVSFINGEDERSAIIGFTLRHYLDTNYWTYYFPNPAGEGIVCSDSSPVIMNCTIMDNVGGYMGGGIACELASPTIVNCTISNNTAVDFMMIGEPFGCGGGIGCLYSSLTISNCKIKENVSGYWKDRGNGGGIYCYFSTIMIANSVISENRLAVCEIPSYWGGGGISGYYSMITMEKCNISNNTGSGIHIGGTELMIKNSTVSENNADEMGGGISCSTSSPTIVNVTISGNRGGSGGGIYCDQCSLKVINSILWHDSAPEGPEIFLVGSISHEVSYSDVEGEWPGTGNIDLDPLFVGGGDYHLSLGSPCIDTGTDIGVYGVCTDIDGDVRPYLSGIDMGSDEYIGECWDQDGDGYSHIQCGGKDCDDSDPSTYPGAADPCDGVDQACDGLGDEVDSDGDTYMICASDCDDSNPLLHPGADEICNGQDDDCDGIVPDDEVDGDGDGWLFCTDCDDTDFLVNPGHSEVPDNGKDDDCDGLIDEPCFIGAVM